MVKLRGADHAVRVYGELLASTSAPRALDPVAIRGRLRARQCLLCGSREWTEVHSKRERAWIDRCARCGVPWRWTEQQILKGRRRRCGIARPDLTERKLVDLADLRAVVEAVPPAELRIYSLYVLGGLSRLETLKRVTQRGWHPSLTEKALRTIVKRARQRIELELWRRGMLAGEENKDDATRSRAPMAESPGPGA